MRRLFRLWRLGREDLRLLFYALRHPLRPAWLLAATVLMLAYAIEPLNFALPLLGFVDDFVLLPLVLHALLGLLPPEIRAGYMRSRMPVVRAL